jgi:acyl-CoA thioesterase FadM
LTLPVIEASCQYVAPCRYDDELTIVTQGRLLSPIRVAFSYAVERPDGVVAARGRTEHAAIARDGRPRRLPALLRGALAAGGSREPR